MNNQNYEQKKRECWEEFCENNPAYDLPYCHRIYEIAFDRAYALGKVKDLISQDEIDKTAEDYVSFEKGGRCYPSYIVERACCRAFKDGVIYALGKQEKDAKKNVIQGLVAAIQAYIREIKF